MGNEGEGEMKWGLFEEMVLPDRSVPQDNTPARTHPLLQPCAVSIAQELHANSRRRSILKPRRSISLTPKTNMKQSSQSQSPKNPKTLFTKLSSLTVKSVLLYDWWLVPADGKGLAVGGFASRGSIGKRALRSAAIVKRHDTTTLETADGITVTISGLINRSRTCLNGFPLEVCNYFLLGFPHCWEEYADQCCGQESVGKGFPTRISSFFEDVMSSGSCSSTFPPFSLDEMPLTRVRDFIMFPQRDVENGCLAQKLFDVVEKCGYSCVQDESARKLEKNGGKFKMDTKVFTPSSIVTRSMSRLKNLVMEQEESLSSKPPGGDEKTSKGRGRGKQSERVRSESGFTECQETTFAQEKQVMGKPDKSTLRRSSRHMNQKKETHPQSYN
ncbi:hypothetical protein Ddye_023573 [Dipteronia dyeriana]|uniref:SANTA domain-containing protein n=1 Tax=Dipteronia dyeriana TaxID=168575 RepID=A0AAD9TT46_9ROSI|nr:hypothetical protein Ddye_023569 [Dipteronia dyeriana]KAK2641810.1 hypothetical protein Ddye_023573 [Dipteronia dyeriana]